MKIAHIADSHLRTAQYGSPSRGAAFFHGLKAAIDAAYREGARIIIHSGDLLDKRPTAYTMMDVYAIHQLLKERHMVMFHTSGNHDDVPYERGHVEYPHVYSRKVSWMSLFMGENTSYGIKDVTTQLMNEDTFPEEVLECVVDIVDENENRISAAFIPYCTKEALLKHMDVIKQYVKENKSYTGSLGKTVDFVVWHGTISEFATFPEADPISLEDLPTGFASVFALGHLHFHKIKNLKDGTIVAYPGSTCMCAADEDAQKQILIYDLDLNKKTIAIQHVPYFTYPIRVFEIASEEDIEKLSEALKNGEKATPDALWNIYEDHRTAVVLKISSSMADKAAQQVTQWSRKYKCVFRCQTTADDFACDEELGPIPGVEFGLRDFAVEFSSNFTPVKDTELVELCSELANSAMDIDTIINNVKQ